MVFRDIDFRTRFGMEAAMDVRRSLQVSGKKNVEWMAYAIKQMFRIKQSALLWDSQGGILYLRC